MRKEDKTTILDRVARNPGLLLKVMEGRKIKHESYIADLIFKSEEITSRSGETWEFKSLLEYGEEEFIRRGAIYLRLVNNVESLDTWHRSAAQSLAEEVCKSLMYEDEEGLILFVRDKDEYRPATRSDASYAHIKRLAEDGSLFDLAMDRPFSWSKELFLNKQNLRAYAHMWYETSDASNEEHIERKCVRREAVWRETLRLMGREPFASSKVPDPTQWGGKSVEPGALSEVATSAEKPVSTKELNTLLTIIALLCKEAKLDYTVSSKTADLILSTAADMGVAIGKTTIREYLKKIPDALESRTR